MAGFLLGVLLLLNAAVVLPALHGLWHDEHGCDEPDCVVLAMAQGSVDAGVDPAPAVRPVAAPLPAPVIPVLGPASADDCPCLPGRAPPA